MNILQWEGRKEPRMHNVRMDCIVMNLVSETQAIETQKATALRSGVLSPSLAADLLSLTKPRIMLLLLISTCCPMILASHGQISWRALLAALIGGGLVSGSASAMNCIYDCDIDTLMERTKNRPLPSGRVSIFTALVFSVLIGVCGILILSYCFHPLAAFLAIFGHLFYVFIYTIWLKRLTPQNIVIGGAAGAIPPLVGWAAVTGGVDLTALLLFLVVFLWTPPHFWALALNKNDDYKKAGVPMLPVVAGEGKTHNQMLFYALLLVPTSVLLVLSNKQFSSFSLVGMTTLGLIFAFKVLQLKRLARGSSEQRVKKAWEVFSFSLIYLALFFVFLVIDGMRS